MNQHLHLNKSQSMPTAFTQTGILQRKSCSCGKPIVANGECAECNKKQQRLQRSAVNQRGPDTAPPIVHDVLRSSGRPLDAATRNFMEPRFGHDFSQVQVHTDSKAAQSAQSVNARAYTVGNHIVFGKGQYAPRASAGQHLMAHELTHVIQQQGLASTLQTSLAVGSAGGYFEREANHIAQSIMNDSSTLPDISSAPQKVQRACGSAAIGSVGGCIGSNADISDFGSSSNDVYKFNKDCDEYLPGEEARLRSFAFTIADNEIVHIHGFASEEGDETFNDNLSCARSYAAASTIAGAGTSASVILYKHGATPGVRADRRSVVIDVEQPAEKVEGETPSKAKPTYVACYDGTTVYARKNGRSHQCAAVTGNVGAPTDNGEYCIRQQGEAQLGYIPLVRDHSKWFLLEPQFSTTRFRMHLHPGSNSAGCVTATDEDCFDQLASVLNGSGTITRTGYDGYPPGNSVGVDNKPREVTCLGLMLVNRTTGGCNSMLGRDESR